MEKTIDDLIKDANSILNTLYKDYETMQSQKSDIRQGQVGKYDDLCDNMGAVLTQYSKTIWDLRNKIDRSYDATGNDYTVYEYPSGNKTLVMAPMLYWMGRVPTFYLKLREKPKEGNGYYSSDEIAVSETTIEVETFGFNPKKGFSDAVSVFLNHCPSYEQLDTIFQTALADFIKHCVIAAQKRNENLTDQIKSITR